MASRFLVQDQPLSKLKEELADIARLDSIGEVSAYIRNNSLNTAKDYCESLQELKDVLRYECKKKYGQMKDLKMVRTT